jgi:hypothetical protein
MFTRVLTDLERRQAKDFLKHNGAKTPSVQVIVSRARKYLPYINADVELLERVIQAYEASKKRH